MTELLSKDHSILERPFMEFLPFGVDAQGDKISDISGVIVLSNVEYLYDFISLSSGPAAAERAVHELCRLLNERLRDPAYHVTPEFLRIRLLLAGILRNPVRRPSVSLQGSQSKEGFSDYSDFTPPLLYPAEL